MNYLYPVLSGISGSLAGYAGKIAFSLDSTLFLHDFFYVEKALAFFIMINLNKLMFQFLFISFDRNGSTITTLMNFISNSVLNVKMLSYIGN